MQSSTANSSTDWQWQTVSFVGPMTSCGEGDDEVEIGLIVISRHITKEAAEAARERRMRNGGGAVAVLERSCLSIDD